MVYLQDNIEQSPTIRFKSSENS